MLHLFIDVWNKCILIGIPSIFNYTASPYYQTHKDKHESPTNKALHAGAGLHVGHQLVRPSQTALSS
jgi:hypothetical protein